MERVHGIHGPAPQVNQSLARSRALQPGISSPCVGRRRNPIRLAVLKAVRPISIARLHPLRGFHLRPIDVVVFHGSSRGLKPTGELFSGGASRLDAFSVYPVRTWLLHVAPGGTMDTPAVRPTRSSRTRVSFLQLSNAHTG